MNKSIFGSPAAQARKLPANTVNNAGGKAYKMSSKAGLAQLAATGCLNNSFYSRAEDQLDTVLKLAEEVDTEFVAKVAVYSRNFGKMKDMPALLVAWLSGRDTELFRKVFPQVINNGKMIRNFVQVMRSGKVGRTSLGTLPRNMVRNWFNTNNPNYIFRNSVGNDPSMADVIKMVHPKPISDEHDALYAYMINKPFVFKDLPEVVQQFEFFKARKGELPDLPFMFLASLDLDAQQWKDLALNCNWNTLRMNLNTFARHGVLQDRNVVATLAKKLSDPEEVKRSNVFPYQLLSAYNATSTNNAVPTQLTNALQDAMEVATENIPVLPGNVYIAIDISGSMRGAVTGDRGTATTSMTCVAVAALMAASILRKNPNAQVLPFNTIARPDIRLNPRDSIVSNAQNLAAHVGGGTACQAALAHINAHRIKNTDNDVIIMISDNESWFDNGAGNLRYGYSNPTATKEQWEIFKKHRPNAKMICIDLAPGVTVQAPNDKSVMNIGGFSDTVFDVIADFVTAKNGADHWVNKINEVKL